MKKNYLFAVAIIASALTGCTQDELVDYNPEIKSDFTATLETVESRTKLDANNKVQWVVNDDYVSLFEKVDVNAKYQVTAVDNNGTAKLSFVSYTEKENYQSLDKYYAVYPYSADNTIAAGDGTITAPVPATYTYKDKESCIASALMVACSDTKELSFKNAQGIIRLKLNAETPFTWGKIQSVSFTSKGNYLNGTATMSWETTTPTAVIADGEETNKSLTINLDESLKKDLPSKQSGNYAEYYFPIVPTTFAEEDMTMTVTFANNSYEKVIPMSFTIGRKQIITLKHSIGSDDFSADIEDEFVSDEVSNEVQLKKALQEAINKPFTITLVNDITLSGTWAPIGDKDKGEYFMGTLDGNGFTIKGLNVVANDYDALISAAKDATIKNLTVEGTVNGVNAAGIVARVEGTTVIENCVSNVTVTGSTKAGGIVCNVTNTNPSTVYIKNCVNNGKINGTGTASAGLGGIIGYVNNDATVNVSDCKNKGNVTSADNKAAGAVIGWAAGTSAGVIVDFVNEGTIIGSHYKNDGRCLEAVNGTILAAYCATPANWAISHEVAPSTITDAFVSSEGVDIKANISNVIFGKPTDYPEIVANHTPKLIDGVSVYQVLNDDNKTYTVYYLSEEKISVPADSEMLFYEMKGLTEFDASNLDMSQVENAKCMFTNCTNLVSIEGVENWDMSNVTNMQSIFYGCNKLESIDVSNWDTSNVTNMRMVFFRCYELSSESIKGVENRDVSNVSNFYSMFKHAYGVTTLDLSKWDTSNATNMSHMFANIGNNLTTLDLSSFDTSNVTDMSWMFYSANKLTTIYVGDGWTTESLDPSNPTCFYNNQALIGGAGTTWLDVCDMPNAARPWESSAKLDYAIVDGGTENPGLLTYKSNE